jgi:DNA polymerase III sliding clamp (beta) subunit (PCNA family)
MKQHEIKTLDDIINVVNEENIDRFMEEFKDSILAAKKFKEALPTLEYKGFVWIDDNKNNINIEIETK